MNYLPVVAVAVIAAASTHAAIFTFTAALNGASEAPPNASLASGNASAVYDDASGQFSIAGTFSGLSAPATAAHVHNAPPGVSGPVVLPLTLVPGGTTSGVFFGVAPTLTTTEAAQLLAGSWYVNVHDATFPGGEIRGQLTLVPEPMACSALAGLGLLGFAAWRRFRS